MALIVIGIGMFFSLVFHFGVKEPEFKKPFCSKSKDVEKSTSNLHEPEVEKMKNTDWFKLPAFYIVALLYMTTRLYVNLYQVSLKSFFIGSSKLSNLLIV